MPESLKSKLKGSEKDVIEFTRLWGRIKAMDRFGIKTYDSFCRFLEAETGDPNFGLSPKMDPGLRGTWAEDLLDAFTAKLLKMEDQKRQLRIQLEETRKLLEYYKGLRNNDITPRVEKVMELCDGN